METIICIIPSVFALGIVVGLYLHDKLDSYICKKVDKIMDKILHKQ